MFKFMTVVVAAATLASAAPRAVVEPVEYTLKPANESIVERALQNKLIGDHTGQKSSYPDGSGTYVKTVDDDRYGGGLGEHCWTDFMHVKAELVPLAWVKDPQSIDCGTTASCESHRAKGSDKCSTWEAGLHFELDSTRDLLTQVMKVTGLTFGFEGGVGGSTCTSAESEDVCVWDDKKCHSVWRSDLVRKDHGYWRRRCGAKGKDRTAWSFDATLDTPVKDTRIGCAATCDMASYPAAVPAAPSV